MTSWTSRKQASAQVSIHVAMSSESYVRRGYKVPTTTCRWAGIASHERESCLQAGSHRWLDRLPFGHSIRTPGARWPKTNLTPRGRHAAAIKICQHAGRARHVRWWKKRRGKGGLFLFSPTAMSLATGGRVPTSPSSVWGEYLPELRPDPGEVGETKRDLHCLAPHG